MLVQFHVVRKGPVSPHEEKCINPPAAKTRKTYRQYLRTLFPTISFYRQPIPRQIPLKIDKMPRKLLSLQLLVFFLISQVAAQYSPVSVGPLLTCDLTTFACPGVSGCCTIAGCCGSGCCANGYTCINEGTSAQACCSVNDPTLCGTKTTVSGSPSLLT